MFEAHGDAGASPARASFATVLLLVFVLVFVLALVLVLVLPMVLAYSWHTTGSHSPDQ